MSSPEFNITPPKGQRPTWDSINRTLDQNMPSAQYDQIRNHYFDTWIKPNVGKEYSVEKTRDLFMQQTQRSKPWAERLGKAGEIVGGLITDAAEISALSAMIGPLSGPLARTLFSSGRAAEIAAKIGRGGITFAAYDVMHAKDGDRVHAGLRGAAVGAAWEIGLGAVLGFGEKELEQSAKNAITGKLKATDTGLVHGPPRPPTEEKAVAEQLQSVVQDAKKKGFNVSPPEFRNSKLGRGVYVGGKNADGSPFQFIIKKGQEEDGYAQLSSILDEGGSWDSTLGDASTAAQSRVVDLYRHFAERAEGAEQAMRMRIVPPSIDNAATTAQQMSSMGLRATVVHEGEVLIGPKAPWKLSQEARARSKAAEEFAAKGGPQIAVNAITGEADLALHRDMYELGRLRALHDLPPDQRGFPGNQPGRDYAKRVNELGKQLANDNGIKSRYDVGRLALRYFEDLTTENPTKTAREIIDDYKGLVKQAGLPELAEGESSVREQTGLLEKGYRTGSPNAELAWSPTDQELRSAPGTIKERPVRTKILETPRERGLYGAVIPGEAGEDPLRVLSRNSTRADRTEENLHYGHIINDVSHDQLPLTNRSRSTATDIIKGIQGKSPQLYSKLPGKQLLDEAFAKAGTAVRLNDRAALDELAKWDTSVAHVKDFVHENAREMLENITGDSFAHRQYARRLRDLVRRTDPNITEALDQAAGQFGWQTWFDPELGKWVMRDGDGREMLHNDLNAVWDQFHNMDPSVMLPDQAHSWFLQGMRSGKGMTGEGNAPNFTVSGTPEIFPRILLGLQNLAQIIRPALDSFSGIQKRLARMGRDDIPLYNAAQALFSAAQRSGAARDEWSTQFQDVMKGVRYNQLKAYGEVFSRPEATWATHANHLGLDAADLDRLAKIKELDRVHHEGKTTINDTLQKLWEYRSVGNDPNRVNWAGPVRVALKKGHLGEDLNIGTVAEWVARQNYESRMGDELKAFQKLRNQFKRTPELQKIMDNYSNFLRNRPDTSQKWINNLVESWQAGANRVRESFNKMLPKGMQIPELRFGGALPTLRALMYTAGLAGRASVAIRDTFQATYGMVAIGPEAFMRGMVQSLTPEGRQLANEAGALLHPRNVRQFFGDISSDMPISGGKGQNFINRMTDILLSPSRIGHNIGRRAVFLGEYEQALKEITRFQEHGDSIQLAKRTSAWFHDAPEKSRLLALAAKAKTPEEIRAAAKEFALSANFATQFGGTPGSALRTGLGRMFGQYATWPLNHLEFTRKLGMRALDTPSKGLPALGMWAAMNVGAYESMKSMGIDVSKWVGISPMGYEGSPAMELAQHLMEAPSESDKGRAARKAILEFPLEFVPGAVEFENLYKAYQKGEVDLATTLGFKTYKEPADQLDLDEQLRKEFGFKPRP